MSVTSSSSSSPQQRVLARFPVEIQEAHTRFLTTGDVEAADQVLLAVLREHMPEALRRKQAESLKDESRLMEDLGFDSLAVAEVVFFLEDLYQVRVPQEQLVRMRCVGDLRAYLRDRLKSAQA